MRSLLPTGPSNSLPTMSEEPADRDLDRDLDLSIRWRDLFDETVQRLAAVLGGEAARREAGWIIDEFAGVDEHGSASRNERVTRRGMAAFDDALRRRLGGEPLQYVLGHWPFRSLDLLLDRRVLIPRPETEWLVDIAIAELARSTAERAVVVDLGTGSGAIGLSIASETNAAVWLTDSSSDALAVARANLAGLGPPAARVRIAAGQWFDALPDDRRGTIDLIVSNPPYVAIEDVLDPSVADWEPSGALFAGRDGLDDIRRIIAGAPQWLATGGSLVVEIGAAQSDAVAELARGSGLQPTVLPDLAGRPRALIARYLDV